MSTSFAVQNGQPPQRVWHSLASFVVPPLSAAAAIVFPFRDMMTKSLLQTGQSVRHITILEGLREGFKAAPTVGFIVGAQLPLQKFVERKMVGESKKESLPSMLASSAVVGALSSLPLAVFNGKTMGWSIMNSVRRFSVKQGLAIAGQETGFVAGMSSADSLAKVMERKFGKNKVVEYTAAFASGAAGSLAGHVGNTALTRWQKGMTVDTLRQSMLGCVPRARALGVFAVLYKITKEKLNSTV